MNQKYIITGAPGTGKTAIINELKKRGFHCIDENSREVIAEQIKNGGEILPWKNQIAFENKISNMRTEQYLTSAKDGLCFFDRSTLDCIAYLKLNNLEATVQIIENIQKCNFSKIAFYTPIWEEIYENDSERIENIATAKKIEISIISTYKSQGYELVEVPKLSIKQRVDFIISKT